LQITIYKNEQFIYVFFSFPFLFSLFLSPFFLSSTTTPPCVLYLSPPIDANKLGSGRGGELTAAAARISSCAHDTEQRLGQAAAQRAAGR
jgi:hypothetical protein